MIARSAVFATLLALASCSTADAPGSASPRALDPAPTEIAWEDFETGLSRAQREQKPFVLVFTATWCSQCAIYRTVLANPQVVAASQDLVMIRVDITEHPDLNQRYAYDGGYVPRTMFFGPDGTHRAELKANARDSFKYFLNPRDPNELLGLMRRALSSS